MPAHDAAAKASIADFLMMAAAASIAYMHTDLQGRVVDRNAFLSELFGDFERWDAEVWLRCFHSDDIPQLIRNGRNAMQACQPLVMQDASRVRDRKGGWIWISICSILDVDARGEPRCWFSFFSPLPPQSFLAERFESARIDSDIRYRALFDHSSDTALLIFDERVVECNAAAEQLFRAGRGQLLGCSVRRLAAMQQRNGETVDHQMSRLRTIIDGDGVTRWQATIRPIDGSAPVEVEVTAVPMVLGADRFALVTLHDITTHLQIESELHETNHALALQNQTLTWLQDALSRIHAQPDLDALAGEVLCIMQAHHSAPIMQFGVRDGDEYRLLAASAQAQLPYDHEHVPRSSILDTVIATEDKVLVVTDLDAGFGVDSPFVQHLRRRGIELCVLLLAIDNGEELGVVILEYDDASRFHNDYLNSFKVLIRTLSLAVAKIKHLTALEYQARHDGLTGLHNRTVLHNQFALWQAGINAEAMLFLLDLNRFKEINDTLGHHVGDDLLRQIGGRLRQGLNYRRAVVCRLGGDEFAVLVTGQSAEAGIALELANEILAAIRQPFLVNGVHLEISAAVGVSLYPEHGADSHALLRFADVAMYEAKHSGAGALVYDTRLDLHSPERLRVIVDLNSGIRARELLLHYQPKLDLRTGIVVGCEALVRWQHPQQGILMPDSFLPLAEVGDTIHALTEFVIEEAILQQRKWLRQGIDLHVAVNLSARNLIDDRICLQLERLILEHELPPGTLELEITETALMHDPNRAIALLERIARLGVHLSIDDFGTGYSSLSYLRRLPIDTLKIDRSFIHDMVAKPQDAVIVQSIITLGHNLDLTVIAEGVEDAAVLDCLQAMDCDHIQGYFLSRPLPAAQIPDWLAAYAAAGPSLPGAISSG
jgi:diguanylate cyclase (GGDEF)-like protein/PAS domain S-box-containing protein